VAMLADASPLGKVGYTRAARRDWWSTTSDGGADAECLRSGAHTPRPGPQGRLGSDRRPRGKLRGGRSRCAAARRSRVTSRDFGAPVRDPGKRGLHFNYRTLGLRRRDASRGNAASEQLRQRHRRRRAPLRRLTASRNRERRECGKRASRRARCRARRRSRRASSGGAPSSQLPRPGHISGGSDIARGILEAHRSPATAALRGGGECSDASPPTLGRFGATPDARLGSARRRLHRRDGLVAALGAQLLVTGCAVSARVSICEFVRSSLSVLLTQ